MVRLLLSLGAVIALSGQAIAQAIVDGDTIKLNGMTYRLWGIDAPEASQQCGDGWPAGLEATKALEELIRGRVVTCEARGIDRYRRTIGLCRADGIDLGAAMVRTGMAWAFTRYSSDYVAEERSAIEARSGVHAHECDKAWNWRAQRR